MRRVLVCLALICVGLVTGLDGQQPSGMPPVFRSSREVVSIDVIVRDRSGAIVSDLSADDFEVREDGRLQSVLTASYVRVDERPSAPVSVPLLDALGTTTPPRVAPPPEVAGRRLILLLFDVSGMEPEEVDRGVRAALTFVDRQMTGGDLVAVASLSWELRLLTDFTSDRAIVREALEGLVAVNVEAPETGGGSDVDADAGATDTGSGTAVIGTDARLRALRLLSEAMASVPQKKALLYFTAGLGNSAQDSPAELRAATTAAARANLSVYPVDTRGLQAVIPSGPAQVGSRGGQGVFSGRDVNEQFNDLTASQDTLASLASASGGRLFAGTNDLGPAFLRAQRDTAAYYLLGYSSGNEARDGRFRRVSVRVKRPGLRVEARTGYYADRDFAHTSRADREAELQARAFEPAGTSNQLVRVGANWVPQGTDDYAVTMALATSLTPGGTGKAGFDILTVVEDEQGRAVARVRETLDANDVTTGTDGWVYTSTVQLPPGQFRIRSVVRENGDGAMDTAEATIVLPRVREALTTGPLLATSGLPLSVVTMARESAGSLQFVVYGGTDVPDTRVVSLSVFRDGIRVAERTMDGPPVAVDAERGAVVYRVALPDTLESGQYVCQVTVVDPSSARFAIAREALVLR